MAIYKLWQAKFTEAWYALSSEEQGRLLEQVGATLEQVGGKTVLLCNSVWADERWTAFGVEEFPDIAAVQKHKQLHAELNWDRYMDGTSTLGTEWSS